MQTNKCFSFIVILCILLSPIIVLSQSPKKESGYYINLTGDTVTGVFTNYREWSYSPVNVGFIISGSTKSITLTPYNCSSFSITGQDTYIAYSGTRLINPTDFNSANDEADSTTQTDTASVFLRVIFNNNEIKLALLSDSKRENFFYQTNNQPLIELICKGFFNATGSFQQIATYKTQLSAFFSKKTTENDLDNKISELKYTEPSFLEFFQSIYKVATDKKQKSYYNSSYFVAGGVTLSSFNVNGIAGGAQEVGLNYTANPAPVLHFGVIIPLQRNFGKISFSPQLKIFSYKSSGTFNGINNSLYDTTTYTFKSNLSIALLAYFGYNFIQNKSIIWRLAIGGGGNYLMNDEEQTNMKYNPMANSTTSLPNLMLTLDLQTTIIIKKRFMLLADYTFPTTVFDFVTFAAQYSDFEIAAGYIF